MPRAPDPYLQERKEIPQFLANVQCAHERLTICRSVLFQSQKLLRQGGGVNWQIPEHDFQMRWLAMRLLEIEDPNGLPPIIKFLSDNLDSF